MISSITEPITKSKSKGYLLSVSSFSSLLHCWLHTPCPLLKKLNITYSLSNLAHTFFSLYHHVFKKCKWSRHQHTKLSADISPDQAKLPEETTPSRKLYNVAPAAFSAACLCSLFYGTDQLRGPPAFPPAIFWFSYWCCLSQQRDFSEALEWHWSW